MRSKYRVISQSSLLSFIQKLINKVGLAVVKIQKHPNDPNKINLNIGSGDSFIPGFINLDMPSLWYSKVQARNKFIPFDAFKDELPFAEMSVSNIYISHVIEHLPESIATRLILDSLRCLKSNGVLRLCFPDPEFLFGVTKAYPQFWERNETDFFKSNDIPDGFVLDEFDYLSHELASKSRIGFNAECQYSEATHLLMKKSGFETCMKLLFSDSVYSAEHPGRHVSWWTFSKLKEIGFETKFPGTKVIDSKYQGSVSKAMTGFYFDRTVPFLSSYVEFIKA